MKKLLLPALLVSAVCGNAQITKKVVLYDFTGVKCQHCTKGTKQIEGFMTNHPDNFIGIQIHTGSYTPAASPLKTPEGDAFLPVVTPGGYPAGAVDMSLPPFGNPILAMNPGYWKAAVDTQLNNRPAIASISIDKRVDLGSGNYEATLNIKFASKPSNTPLKVQAFLIEDSIKAENGLEQTNANDGPFSGASPLTWATHKYVHNNVLRKAVSGDTWGYSDVLTGTIKVDSVYSKKINFTLNPSWNKKNMRVVAIVAYDGSTNANKQIINGEQIHMNAFWKTDIDVVSNVVDILHVYPNPAKIGDVINIGYNIQNSEKVTFNVYNAVGQKVSTPYISDDVKGSHTITWKTGLENLTPGMYILEVATPQGKHSQRISLQ